MIYILWNPDFEVIWILNQYLSHIYLSKILFSFLQSHLIIPNFLRGLKMITIRFLYGILTGVGSAFTALLNMQCWKLELTKTVNRNANCSFFELIRQNMRFKTPQWYIRKYAFFFFFFFFFCNLLTEPGSTFKMKLFYANQNKITKWMNDLLSYPPLPYRKSKNVLIMWWVSMKWPNRPTWYCSHMKKLTSVLHVGFVLFPVCQIIFCWKWHSSEHVQTDGFELFWYSNFVFLMIAFTTGLSGFVQTIKAPIFSVNMN